MQTSRIGLTIAAALLATPASAQALPTFTTDRACYAAEWDYMRINGQGFTPGAEIGVFFAHNGRLGNLSTRADGGGAFEMGLPAFSLEDFDESAAFDVGVTANDQTKFGPDGPIGPPEEAVAFGEVRISERDVDVAAWNADGPATARRGQRLRLRAVGWGSAGSELYVHYQRGGRTVRSERLGALTGPCGDLRTTFRAFAFQRARPGTYAVRFTTAPKWSAKDSWIGYRAVRLR